MFELHSSLKQYTLDQDKVRDPAETVKIALARLQNLYDVSHFQLLPRFSPIPETFAYTASSDQFNSSGKGLTEAQCRASAIMEYCERYSWIHFAYKTAPGYVMKSYDDLAKETTDLPPPDYFISTNYGLKEPDQLLTEIKAIPLKWIKGVSLNSGRPYYYPINWHNMAFGSNGLAGGNTLEEGILQGLCEVIERENLFRLFVAGEVGNDLDPNSIKNPLIKKILARASSYGISFILKDVSFDLGIPTFIAYGTSTKDTGLLSHQGCGQGTHTDPEKALIRAITEYFEGFTAMLDAEKKVDAKIIKEYFPKLPKRHLGFVPLYRPEVLTKKKKTVALGSLPNLSRPDIKEEIESLLKILSQHGYPEVVFINKIHPQLQLPALRIMVPGMRNVMGLDLITLNGTISEVYHEAGNSAAALQHLIKYCKCFPVFRPLAIEYSRYTSSSQIYQSKDYTDNLIAMHGFKRNAADNLRRLNQRAIA